MGGQDRTDSPPDSPGPDISSDVPHAYRRQNKTPLIEDEHSTKISGTSARAARRAAAPTYRIRLPVCLARTMPCAVAASSPAECAKPPVGRPESHICHSYMDSDGRRNGRKPSPRFGPQPQPQPLIHELLIFERYRSGNGSSQLVQIDTGQAWCHKRACISKNPVLSKIKR